MTDQLFSSDHEDVFILATLGENLTLKCFDKKNFTKVFWYKQSLGEKPRPISTEKNATTQHEENNRFFTLDSETDKNDLRITNLSASDLAFYFCTALMTESVQLGSIVYVTVKESGSTAVAACGHMLFGTGTQLNLQCKQIFF